MTKSDRKYLTFEMAIAKLRTGSSIVVMHDHKSATGKSFFVVPGGYVDVRVAEKIIKRPDVIPADDGLFPGCTQSWKMGG